ncbi:MAG: phnA protein [Hahellaceae bacterium]|nr:phnA protein [Hahellaceae bacterium]
MSKALDRHEHRRGELDAFGRDLVRRSHAHCELCRASGVGLSIYEVSPIPVSPDIEKVLFVCETCRDQLEHPRRLDEKHWRCLQVTAWSELPVVKVMSLRVLRVLQQKQDWARELLEQLYIDEISDAWANAAVLGE